MPKTTMTPEKTENNFYALLKEMLETQSQTLKEVKELREEVKELREEVKELREEFKNNKSGSASDAWSRM